MGAEERLKAAGIVLAPKGDPKPAVATCVEDDGLLYISGHGPENDEGQLQFVGRVGREVSVEQGYEAARLTGIQLLRAIRAHTGSLDRVERVVKVLGFVNSADDFHDQPKVINGASDLFLQIFGQSGRHARSAMGTNNLPGNQPVEIEMIVRIAPAK
ncbi:MAG TPA: RidA family protein [Kaistia sp.]|nr:RidA family protein [Kaistia sp.]